MEGVFDATLWMPRYHCGYFPGWLVAWLTIVSCWICISYLRIPLALLRLDHSLQEGLRRKFPKLLPWFAAFIFSCGVGHLIHDVMPFVWPNYLVIATWATSTAVVSHVAADKMGVALRGVARDSAVVSELLSEIDDVQADIESPGSEDPADQLIRIADRLRRIREGQHHGT